MSEHSNSKNSNYSNFSFSNYLKNPAVIGKNEYENCQNINLGEFTESFHSSENNQSENIPNFGVAPKFVSAGFGSSPNYENVTKIEFVEDTKSDPKVTSLHDTGLGPNYITEFVDKSVPKFELPHGNEIGPNYITHSIDYTKSLTKGTSLHGIGLGPNYISESIAESVPKVESPHVTEKGPNYLAQSIDYTKSLTKATSPHGIGLGPNYVTESVENTKSVPAYRIDEILNKLEALAVSNNGLANEIRNSNDQIKNAITVMNDSVMNQTQLTSSIKSLIEELKKKNN